MWDGYYRYAYCILAISIWGVVDSLYETVTNINKIRKMAMYECDIQVRRLKNGV
jgi:hypothetical protein